MISATLCAPALPYIKDYFGSQFSILQFVITLFMLGNAFGQFISGPLSDQIGQKKVLTAGLILYTLASIGCALAENMPSLIAFRFIQGMGSAVGPVLARAIAANMYSVDVSAKVKSYGAIAIGLVSIITMLFSGQVTLISWRGNFWLASLFGAFLLFWSRQHMNEVCSQSNTKVVFLKSLKEMKEILFNPDFLKNGLPHAFTHGVMYGYIILFPFALNNLFSENTALITAFLSGVMIVFYMLGAGFSARFVEAIGSAKMLRYGVFLQLLSGICLFFAPSMFILPAIVLFNLSIGIVLPVSAARSLFPFSTFASANTSKSVKVGGASSCLGLLTRFLSAFISMAISQFSPSNAAGLALSIIAISILSSVCLMNEKEASVQNV